jgi:hypothetical protein
MGGDTRIVTGRSLTGIVAVLVMTAVGHADMTPVRCGGGEPFRALPVCSRAESLPAVPGSHSPGLACFKLDASRCVLPSPTAAGIEPYRELSQPVYLLRHNQGSLKLCLYALLGVGLCRSRPLLARRLSVTWIPDWYHGCDPCQIGGRSAVGPDCLCTQVVCFVQPRGVAHDLQREYDPGTLTPLVRKSLFTPNVQVPRGPPSMA